jgi:hypothetical protein
MSIALTEQPIFIGLVLFLWAARPILKDDRGLVRDRA